MACEVTASQRLALYRTAQEGLTNIQRHAAAHQAWLRLECSPGRISLQVLDDGKGLPAKRGNPAYTPASAWPAWLSGRPSWTAPSPWQTGRAAVRSWRSNSPPRRANAWNRSVS